ncbi:DNA polymerase beta superfamily protein [Bacillus sp. Wb]
MQNLMECLVKQKEILESQGHTVAYISIYGSQNYGLQIDNDEYTSDVDMKAIVVPTLDQLVRNSKPISTTIETEWGQCDLKDIRTYFQTLLKANPAYIETLYTNYYIIDEKFTREFDEIFSLKDKLVETLSAQFLRSMYGMMCEKGKAMCHPYPTIAHKIEKFGYDGKQVHHILRLWIMMKNYFEDKKPLAACMFPNQYIKALIDFKLNKPSLDSAKIYVTETMKEAKEFRDAVLSNIDESKLDYSIKDKFLALSQDIIKNKIIEECRG